MANRHNGANGGHFHTRDGLSSKQKFMLQSVNAGFIYEKGNIMYDLRTAKSLFDRGLVQLEITDNNWICRKVEA